MKVVNIQNAYEVFKDNGVSIEDMAQMVKTEIEVMRILDSPFVVRLHDSFQVSDGDKEETKAFLLVFFCF